MMNLVEQLKLNPFVLAPMAGITDNAFRGFMREMGCGPVITELVSAHGIQFRGHRTLDLMAFSSDQRPFGVQIFGEDPEILARAARFIEEMGADFVDINLGCPVPKVVTKGAGAALLRNPCELHKILAHVKANLRIPLTIKIRTGWDEKTINAHDIVKAASDAGVTWVAIHGRTRAQGYSGFANWNLIAEVKSRSPIPIIGNGDILTAEVAVDRLRSTGCDGVMIGRGCLKNPWIFFQARDLLFGPRSENIAPVDFTLILDLLKRRVDQRHDSRYSLLTMKKFTSWFSSGYPFSQGFRKTLFNAQTSDEILELARDYFAQFALEDQVDTSGDGFLMGGHG